jgi:hypothetical protein
MKHVIRAIMVRSGYDLLSFVDFDRFLAMFGPVKTIILKISSLLTFSNGKGKWLTLDLELTMNMHVPAFVRSKTGSQTASSSGTNCALVFRALKF